MSASLVGSEMCIRDSLETDNEPTLVDLRQGVADALAGASGSDSATPQAVSYTHLTLPTICSV
eukprot:5273667-Alexandrium_andersonii.AAC.1